MAVLPIVTLPDPVLRRPSAVIEEIDDEIRGLAADLCDTLRHNDLAGMAAIMVGIPLRIAIVAVDGAGPLKQPEVMINPEIIAIGTETAAGSEACPSVPGTQEEIDRAVDIKVAWTDLDGTRREISAKGHHARVIQHEIDLCDGILFIDRLSRLKRSRIEKRIAKAARRSA